MRRRNFTEFTGEDSMSESATALNSEATSPESNTTPESIDEPSPSSKKRRLEDGTQANVQDRQGEKFRRIESLDDPDKYSPGSVMTVKCQNFVTYTDAEFKIGPYMNVIIGPNGTGKSTLVCAICLALGFKTEVLGRAKEPSEFIKNGGNKALITVQLKGHKGKRNTIISRTILQDRSEWTVNNARSTNRAVKEIVSDYNIQIDNLCQFLPQDRMAEFARLPPKKRLTETLRAIAPDLLNTQTELGDLYAEVCQHETKKTADINELTKLKKFQEQAEVSVERLRKREEAIHELKVYEDVRVLADYTEAAKRSKQSKALYKDLMAQLKDLGENGNPNAGEIAAVKEEITKLQKGIQTAKAARSKIEKKFEEKHKRLDDLHNSFTGYEGEINALKEDKSRHTQKGSRLEAAIQSIQDSIGKGPPDVSELDSLREQRTTLHAELVSISGDVSHIEGKVANIAEEERPIIRILEGHKDQLSKLHDEKERKLTQLERMDKDAFKAYQWLQKNRDKFNDRVYEPPVLNVRITNTDLADQVESCIQPSLFRAFTCTNREDYHTFAKHVIDDMHLHVSVKEFSNTNQATLADIKYSCPKEELTKLGLGTWALDYLEGPDPVLNMLAFEANLHTIPISRAEVPKQTLERLEHFRNSNNRLIINRLVTANTNITMSMSGYTGNISVISKNIGKSRILCRPPLDPTVVQKLRDGIHDCQEKLSRSKDQKEEYEKELRDKTQLKGDITRKITDVKAKQEILVAKSSEYKRLCKKLDFAKGKLDQYKQLPTNFDERILAIEQEKMASCLETRKKLISECSSLLANLRDGNTNLLNLVVRYFDHEDKLKILEETNEEYKRRVEELQQKCAAHKVQVDYDKKTAISKKHKITDIQRNLGEEEIEEIQKAFYHPDTQERMTLAEVDAHIDTLKARLEMGDDNRNRNLIQEYEERARVIAALELRITNSSDEKEKLQASIDKLRSDWEPRIDAISACISADFSDAFEFVGNAGEVEIGKVDDFRDWRMDILVKFRDNEKLEVLTHQRQSGGERAVSTMFYLLSMQSLTKAPFRVVDEINQGMDTRNERLVYRRLVEVACNTEKPSQYFLLTPKLLPDLIYHPLMRVHCIYSGDWLPSSQTDKASLRRIGRLQEYTDNALMSKKKS